MFPMDERSAALLALGPETKILSRVVTNIANITGEECDNEGYTVGSVEFTQYMLACNQFLGAVATNEHPLPIFFDDFQWADHSSFRLIEAMLLTSIADSRHVLFVWPFATMKLM
jgi:histidine kinase